MYNIQSSLILGFHGCDQSTLEKVVNQKEELKPSENKYDWLGHGIYFWENSISRALQYAEFIRDTPRRTTRKVENPAVLGAVIKLGHCLDLTDFQHINLLKKSYQLLATTFQNLNLDLPTNKKVGAEKDLLLRELDCLVIQTLHLQREDKGLPPFDSVRGIFWEGEEIYPNAGIKEKTHVQICIRNPNCIKGYFLPRRLDDGFSDV